VTTSATLDVEKESKARGWAWGQAVHGEVVTPTKAGLQTVRFQRGVVTALTDTTVVVTSVDGYARTYTVTAGTALVVPKAARRRGPTTTTTPTTTTPTTSAVEVDPTATTSTPTTSTATSTSTSAPTTSRLTVGLQVRVWGYGTADRTVARLVIADPRAPRPTATPTPTTTTPTTTTTTGSTPAQD
jgi:hypothetical protein